MLQLKNTVASGFTLFEVLIAIVVFSIGLLGIASMQVSGYKLSHDSMLRSIASMQANDMVDRMRANFTTFSLGVASPYHNTTGTGVANPSCIGKDGTGAQADVSCTPVEIAQHDFYEWNAMLQGQSATAWHPAYTAVLPQSSGIVCVDSTPLDGSALPDDPMCDGIIAVPGKPVFAIKIWWRERKDEDAPTTLHRFVTSVSL